MYTVYVAEYGSKEIRTKVGISTNVNNRMGTGHPFVPDIKVIHTRNCKTESKARQIEDKIKKKFKKYAIVNSPSCEVFSIDSASVVNTLKKLK